MEGFLWGAPTSKPQAVIMTEDHARTMITEIVKQVTSRNDGDALEMYKQLARLEIDLARARDEMERRDGRHREEIERKDAEIAALRAHIDNIQRFMTVVPNAIAGQMPVPAPYGSYQNNASQPWSPSTATAYPVPMYQDRVAASAPFPTQVPMPAQIIVPDPTSEPTG